MNKVAMLAISASVLCCPVSFGQDIMKYGLPQLKVIAEDQKIRVMQYTPHKGDRTPVHSHPMMVVYVVKGGHIKYTMQDGSTKISELKTGEALIRQPVTHSDQALDDDMEMILIEIKQ
jgi:quercetin dioxygenase-like cupin family protein